MKIQNNFPQQYDAMTQKKNSNQRANLQPDFQGTLNSYDNSLNDQNRTNRSNPLPNASQSVQVAWEKAQQKVGKENLGISADGKLSYIPGYMMAQIEQQAQKGNGDVFGSSIESALVGAQKVLERLNNPLSAPSSAGVATLKEKEKLFYEAFIEQLVAAQSAATAKETGFAESYAKTPGVLF